MTDPSRVSDRSRDGRVHGFRRAALAALAAHGEGAANGKRAAATRTAANGRRPPLRFSNL